MNNLQIRELAKRYGDAVVFSHVSLDVAPGEFVAIVGESGVGKSTLLNCMAGLDNWDEGTITLDGQDIATLRDEERAMLRRRQIGFVFQAFHVLPHLDVAQNVALPLMLLGKPVRPLPHGQPARARYCRHAPAGQAPDHLAAQHARAPCHRL